LTLSSEGKSGKKKGDKNYQMKGGKVRKGRKEKN
jgi:hypothetical protein